MAERLRTAIRQLTDLGVRRLEHLELLLVLGRSPIREWGADEVAAALSLPFTSVSDALEHLHKHQLLALPDPSRPRYRIADRQLVRFEGIGTIRDAKGGHGKLRIDFAQAAVAIDAGALQRARETPLGGACGSGM